MPSRSAGPLVSETFQGKPQQDSCGKRTTVRISDLRWHGNGALSHPRLTAEPKITRGYIPNAMELGLPAPHPTLSVPMNKFFSIRSANGRIYYNTKDYLHRVGNRMGDIDMDPMPTDRVVELLGYTFSRWHDSWYRMKPPRAF